MVTVSRSKAKGVPMGADRPISRWAKVTASVYAVAWGGLIVATWGRLGADFWPPDRSFVGPNLVASVIQATVIAIVAFLVWPPFRRRLHRLIDRKLSPLHDHLAKIHAHNEWHARLLARQHRQITGEDAPDHPHFDVRG